MHLLGSLCDRVCFPGDYRWGRRTLPKKKKRFVRLACIGGGKRGQRRTCIKKQSSKHQQERLTNCSFPAKNLLTKGKVRVKTR